MMRNWYMPSDPTKVADHARNHITLRQCNRQSLKIQNNTTLEIIDDETTGIRFHNTFLVRYYKDKPYCTIHNGGFYSPSTMMRINTYVPHLRLYSHKWEWYIDTGDRTPRREIKCSCCHGNSPEFTTELGRLAHLSCKCSEMYIQYDNQYRTRNDLPPPAWF